MISETAVDLRDGYVGIDIAMDEHRAAIVSHGLLKKHRHFRKCPTIAFENSERGFDALLAFIRSHANTENICVLVESTGPYGVALVQFLHAQGHAVYEVKPRKRLSKQKTDKADALSLANILYTQVALGADPTDESLEVRRLLPMSETAALLSGLVGRRRKLGRDETAAKNRLSAIAIETFPEFREVFKDPNGPTALQIRRDFPTREAIAGASFAQLKKYRKAGLPSDAALASLPELAKRSIGTRNPGRVRSLEITQTQLIEELLMAQRHLEVVEAEIARIVSESREGKILLSIPPIGPVQAAEILVPIGRIENFATAAKFKGFAGWAPKAIQTGVTKDSSTLPKHAGNAVLRNALYLVAWRAVQGDSEWAEIYQGLIMRMCPYDERIKNRRRKNKAMGRMAGQIAGLIYRLLKRDADALAALSPGEPVPEPVLYNREVHRSHRFGQRSQRSTRR